MLPSQYQINNLSATPDGLVLCSYNARFQAIAANVSVNGPVPSSSEPLFSGPDLATYDTGKSYPQKTYWNVTGLFSTTTFGSTGKVKYATDHWYRYAASIVGKLSH
jgi:hypothetical protein